MDQPTIHPPKAYADAIAVSLAVPGPNIDRMLASLRTGMATLRDFTQGLADVLVRAGRALAVVNAGVHNDPVNVAGVSGRYLVRAGHLDDEGFAALLRSVLNGDEDDTRWMTLENRALVLQSALCGYAHTYAGDAPAVLAWDRQFGHTRVLVGRAA